MMGKSMVACGTVSGSRTGRPFNASEMNSLGPTQDHSLAFSIAHGVIASSPARPGYSPHFSKVYSGIGYTWYHGVGEGMCLRSLGLLGFRRTIWGLIHLDVCTVVPIGPTTGGIWRSIGLFECGWGDGRVSCLGTLLNDNASGFMMN